MQLKLYTSSGILESLSNLNFNRGSSLFEVYDAIEDSNKNPHTLVKNLSQINMVRNNWRVDRTKETYCRLKHIDRCGNISFLVVEW